MNDIKFDKEISANPVEKPRRCTDIICCFIFSATFVGMFICSFIGYIGGEPWKLIAPIDADGNICGYTTGYEDYTHLFIGKIDEAASPSDLFDVFDYGVCVKECPVTKTETVECVPTKEVTYCQPKSGEQYTSYELFSYCIPNYDSLPADVQENWDTFTSAVAGSSFGSAFADIMTAKWVILISVFICLLVTFLYIFLMHYCAFWLSWISVGLIQAMLVAIGYFAFDYRRD